MDLKPMLWIYSLIQWILDKLLSPTPPPPNARLSRPRIAVIGAGLTGVSAASHCVGHGFDVTIFEAGDEKRLGGIWSVSPANSSTSQWVIDIPSGSQTKVYCIPTLRRAMKPVNTRNDIGDIALTSGFTTGGKGLLTVDKRVNNTSGLQIHTLVSCIVSTLQ